MTLYLLTGATGAVGSRILEQLLLQTSARVLLLVRSDSQEGAEQRKRQLLQKVLGAQDSDYAARVVAIRGDTKLPRLGMSVDQYERVAAECQRVIHSAGLVRMNLSIEEARESSVSSAEHIISLASAMRRSGQLEKIEFVSTVGVGGRTKDVVEEWIETPSGFHNTYEQAKYEAERRIRSGISEGLPITVHRPSMVVGDAVTGRIISFQVFYHLCEFLSGLRSHGFFPAFGHTGLDTVPVDYVAQAILWSSNNREAAGKILHLCSGPRHAIPIKALQREIAAAFRARGIRVPPTRIIPRSAFRAMLLPLRMVAPPRIRRAINTAPIFLDYLASEQVFHNEATNSFLRQSGIAVPPPSAYLGKILNFYLDRRE